MHVFANPITIIVLQIQVIVTTEINADVCVYMKLSLSIIE